MSVIFNKISKCLNEALKNKDPIRVLTLRSIISQKKDKEIELRTTTKKDIQDEDLVGILNKMMKQRKESITMYIKGDRQDLIEKEKKEIEILEEFLPKQMNEEEILTSCQSAIKECGAAIIKDMGKVMKILREKYLGKIDFSKAGQILRQNLK